MVTYLYRCPERHESTTNTPMGQAPATVDCACGARATRAYTAPMVRSMSGAQQRVHDAAAESTERPRVAHRAPDPTPTPHSDPRHALLPRD